MITREDDPADWQFLGRERLTSADALFSANGSSLSGVELLQEGVVRYLKGYLVSRGWRLERIHVLNRLLEVAAQFDPRFARFQPRAASLNEQFWAQHYPGDDLTEVGADYETLRQQAGELAVLIERAISAGSAAS